MQEGNSSLLETLVYGHRECHDWDNGTENGMYHLSNSLLFLGYMGGSGMFGAFYIYGFLLLSFLCHALWGWMLPCGSAALAWGILLGALCGLQLVHLLLRLHWNALPGGELHTLYNTVFRPLGTPRSAFRQVMEVCGSRVLSLDEEEAYALEGTTPIDRLSFLLSGRIRVSLEGQFLHYIFPFQFLDSPEWESLRPAEEGKFQVTLTAETDCRYVSWRRQKLQTLLARDYYLARLFSVMLGCDIADKLYSLNHRLFVKHGVRLDIRLPGLHHALTPQGEGQDQGGALDPNPTHQLPPLPPQPDPGKNPLTENPINHDSGSPQPRLARAASLPGEDSSSLALEDFGDMVGSLAEPPPGPSDPAHRETGPLLPPRIHLNCDPVLPSPSSALTDSGTVRLTPEGTEPTTTFLQ
ncbi:hypothetical protein JZ751_029169 [Albula glossodonta]|uniref:POPDC1-3 domain-containing protein n=1 Tax=Albula glossodonta TaxID=121402 RepID=A0A8T2PGU4_9TELE|nr:hypothetical protein JZ751_029169 [Albula glossodonta]